jgi:pimeloyl-ACP methyl ester carboxylesterase
VSPPPAGLYALEHEPYDEGAPAVVLVHGTLDRSASFNRVVGSLADLLVVVYDRRGYGRSAGVAPTTSLDDHVDDLLAVIGSRCVTVVGHSLGGVIALAAVARRPDAFRSAAIYETPMPWTPWWPEGSAGLEVLDAATARGPEAAVELFIRRIAGDAGWDDLPTQTQDARRAEGPVMLADMAALGTAARRPDGPPFDLTRLGVPVVVGCGGASVAYHRDAARLAAAEARAPLVEIEGAGHLAHVTHPSEFAALARQAVARAD